MATATRARTKTPDTIADVSNDAADDIALGAPYRVAVTLKGASAMLFHRWSVEAVAEKATAAKGSAAKKSDNLESYVWRLDDGTLGLPGEYLRGAIVAAAKFRQDPRSPRKSAMDLYKAAIVSLTDLAPLKNSAGKVAKDWDYLDQRRVTVQRSGITRMRPAMHAGWEATLMLSVLLPQYVTPGDLRQVLVDAGRLVGLADFRPTYGRFDVVKFEELG